MKIQLVRHLWGVDHSHGLDHYLPRWQAAGYEAIEASLRFAADRDALTSFLKASGWRWISQVFSREFRSGGSVREHLDSLRDQIVECLPLEPLFFNAHSGYDGWSHSEAVDFYGAALEMEKELGVTICHETHRQRYFGNPWTTRALLEELPGLKLTCDFSHWVCVAERLLEDCGEIIALAAKHCHHLHARVGHEQGPQVSDPRAPEWAPHLAAHEAWWDIVWKSQQERGLPVSYLVPEFGPPPYLPTLPYTRSPVSDLADVCDWMAGRQAERFERTKAR